MSATPGNDLPGAFPADATADGATHEHNKLHKRDDPRGFAQHEDTPRTQTAGISGLGSTLGDPKSPTATSGNYTYGSQDAAGEQAGPGVMTGAHSRVHNQGQPTSTEATGAPATQDSVGTIKQDNLDDRAGMSAGHGTAGTTGHESSQAAGHDGSNAHSDPYWGDIPRGAGTYNTVVGHGSTEDSHERHPEHREFPLSHGTRHNKNQGTSATESSLTSDSPTAGQGTYNTVVGHGSPEDTTLARDNTTSSATDTQHKDSHGKEAATATGVGAAGAGAYAAHKHHAKDQDTTTSETTSPEQKEKDSKIGGLFSRGHKDESPKHETVKHEKEPHHEKTKDDGEKKILGIFPTRSKKDSEHHEAGTTSTTAPYSSQDTTTTTAPAARAEQESHHGRDAALAGTGVAGAGYAAHKHGEHKEEKKSQDLSREEPSSSKKSESKLHGLFHRSSNKEKESKDTEVTGGRQALGSNDVPPNAAEYYNGKEASQLAVERERRGKDHSEEIPKYGQAQPQLVGLPPQQGTEPVTIPSGERLAYGTHNVAGTSDTRHGDSYGKETAAVAGLGAAGAGTYAAHKHHEKDDETSSSSKTKSHEEKEKSGSKLGGLFSRNKKEDHKDDHKEEQKDKHHKEAAAAAAGVGVAGVAAGATHRDASQPTTTSGAQGTPIGASTTAPNSKYDTLSSGTASGMAGTHGGPVDAVSTGPGAKYDTLSSGTASGIKGTHAPGERMTDTSSSIYSTDDKSSHGNDKLGYAGIGAAGAGAAAYGTYKAHEHHQNKDSLASSAEPASTRMTDTDTTNPTIPSTQRATEPLSGQNERSVAPVAGTGTGAGVAGIGAYAAHKADEHHKTSPTTSNQPSTLDRTSQDSSHGGQYNVLASGTPSGINVGSGTTHSPPQHDSSTQPSTVDDPLTSSSKGLDNSTLAAAGGAAALGGAGAGAYAASRGGNQETSRPVESTTSTTTTAPVASSTTTAPVTSSAAPASTGKSYEDVIASAPERQAASGSTDTDIHGRGLVGGNERKIDTAGPDQNLGDASYANKPTAPTGSATSSAGGLGGAAVGAGAATAAARTAMGHLSKPVVHTCEGCGKENDISKYFKNEEGVVRQ